MELTIRRVRVIMTKAAILLLGVAPRVSVTPVRYGERMADERGVGMWRVVMSALQEVEAEAEMVT
jgi:hypothetical protein